MATHRVEYEFEMIDLGPGVDAERFAKSSMRKLNLLVFAGTLAASVGVFIVARFGLKMAETDAFLASAVSFFVIFPVAWLVAIRKILSQINILAPGTNPRSSRFLFVDETDQTILFGDGFQENHYHFADVTDLLVTPDYVKFILRQQDAYLVPREGVTSGDINAVVTAIQTSKTS